MRSLIFIAVIIGLAYVLFLQKEEVEKFDLDDAENKIEQVEKDVEKALDKAQENLDKALNNK